MVDRRALAQSFHEMFRESAKFGKVGKGVSRVACSREDGAVRDWFVAWLTSNGFHVIIDQIGNIFGLLDFAGSGASVVLTGSHLDSQPNGGRFDGAYGVIAAAQAAHAIKSEVVAGRLVPRRNLCVVNWTNEEGARFQPSLLGSGVYAGRISLADALAVTDGDGVSVRHALHEIGYAGSGQAPRADRYVELHIECGPELEETGKTVGVTEKWWGAIKLQVSVKGEQAHTGPTAMRKRKDALFGAGLLIAGIRELADLENSGGTERLYTSVGRIEVEPNSPNVVPSSATLFVELRSYEPDVLKKAEVQFRALLKEVEQRTCLPVTIDDVSVREAGHFDPDLVKLAWESAQRNNYPALAVATVAGHDAIPLASVCQSVLVVTPSAGGICHHEDEFTADKDLEAGLFVLTDMLERLCAGEER
jgi:beta-ureidopropionase / N-carbamoyl-L-amino-acid hydrolase